MTPETTPKPTAEQEAAARQMVSAKYQNGWPEYGVAISRVITAVAALIAERDATRAERDALRKHIECCICGCSLADGVSIALDGEERVAHPICVRERDEALAAPPGPAPAKPITTHGCERFVVGEAADDTGDA